MTGNRIGVFLTPCFPSDPKITSAFSGHDWSVLEPVAPDFKLLMLSFAQVIAATNRVDILDPALLRSGRLDRKIEFPMPNEEARARIMQIHSRKMNVR